MAERRVFVTGATGFIGAPLVHHLLEGGWQVAALLRPSDDGARLGTDLGRIQVVRGALADPVAWGPSLARWQPTACVHLAWNTTPGVYLDTRENLDWLTWSGQLFAMLQKWGCRQIVGVGTCAEYDADHRHLHEGAATRPLTLYAACKASLRLIGQQLAAQDSVKFSWTRLFAPYGPAEDERRLVPSCIRALLAGARFPATSGTQVRDFLHVDDMAAGIARVLDTGYEGDVNVCSGEPVELRHLLGLVEKHAARPGAVELGARTPRGWDPPFLSGDSGRLRSLGWQPRYTLDQGIEATVRWWRERG